MIRAILPVLVLAIAPSVLGAQQPARQTEVIEIRGQVPTPQVVTVRPRAVPEFRPDTRVSATYDPAADAPALAGLPTSRALLGEPAFDVAPPIIAAGPPPEIVMGDSATLAQRDGGMQPGAPGGAGAPLRVPLTAADSARLERDQEIAAIRAELERRRARLDSLAAEVRRLGQPPRNERSRDPRSDDDDVPPSATPGPGAAPARRQHR
jgi:hypothetical protein